MKSEVQKYTRFYSGAESLNFAKLNTIMEASPLSGIINSLGRLQQNQYQGLSPHAVAVSRHSRSWCSLQHPQICALACYRTTLETHQDGPFTTSFHLWTKLFSYWGPSARCLYFTLLPYPIFPNTLLLLPLTSSSDSSIHTPWQISRHGEACS